MQPTTSWFQSFNDEISTLANEFQLDEKQTPVLRDFILNVARDQFKTGNRSGVAWAFSQMKNKISQDSTT